MHYSYSNNEYVIIILYTLVYSTILIMIHCVIMTDAINYTLLRSGISARVVVKINANTPCFRLTALIEFFS